MEPEQLRDASNPVLASDLHEAIRRRAEEIYIRSGRIPGRDVDNWTQAEHEILEEAAKSVRRNAIVVKVNGVRYVSEYRSESSDGYVPGEFGAGATVTVRFRGDQMFVRRKNGKELATRILERSDEHDSPAS